ncbi:helix-turn-helix transcriptional regulator [Vibrio breoganii]|uniref:helix-turn-helix transcriptional regulator n=1 Tax=Vibrio breoganii TaxID=553239 RepID=UPI000C828DFE|nr:response regulator transcription factor [Vibrio breoganii]PMO90520.1 helix-turn-helix transcriptional regulator [Vibrio breoganii]
MSLSYACGYVVTRSDEFASASTAILKQNFSSTRFSSFTCVSDCFCPNRDNDSRSIYLIDMQTVSSPVRNGVNPVHEHGDWLAVNVEDQGFQLGDWILNGFSGVVMKRRCLEQLAPAVEAVSHGELWYSRQDLSKLAKAYVTNEFDPHVAADDFAVIHALTPKEKHICLMILKGLNNPQIAESVNVSINTVKTHASSVMRKVNVHSRAELIALAVQQKTNSPKNHPMNGA